MFTQREASSFKHWASGGILTLLGLASAWPMLQPRWQQHRTLASLSQAFQAIAVQSLDTQVQARAEYQADANAAARPGASRVKQLVRLKNNASQAVNAPVLFTQRIPSTTIQQNGRSYALPDRKHPLVLDWQDQPRLTFERPQGKQWVTGRYDFSDVADLCPVLTAWREGGEGVIQLSLRVAVPAGAETLVDPVFDVTVSSNYNMRFDGSVASDTAGEAVAVGDLNGDGIPDLAIAATRADNAGTSSGSVYVILGGAGRFSAGTGQTRDLSVAANWNVRYDGSAANDYLGKDLLISDVNGDGIPDLVMSATFPSVAKVWVVYGGSGTFSGSTGVIRGLATAANYNVRINGSNTVSDQLGIRMAGGDLDGDGKKDLVVGANYASNAGGSSGSVYAFFANGTNFPAGTGIQRYVTSTANFNVRFDGPATNNYLPDAITVADIDGDGKEDLVMGCADASTQSRSQNGAAYVVMGGPVNFPGGTGLTKPLSNAGSFNLRVDGNVSSANLGQSVVVGHFHGGALPDLVVGSGTVSSGSHSNNGAAWALYAGSPALAALTLTGQSLDLAVAANWNARLDGDTDSWQMGFNGGTAANVDGNPGDELVLASINASPNGTGSGCVWSIPGGLTLFPSGSGNVVDLSTQSALVKQYWGTSNGGSVQSEMGFDMAVGDLNNDGAPDMVFGSAGADLSARIDNGGGYVLYGSTPVATPTPTPTPSPTATQTVVCGVAGKDSGDVGSIFVGNQIAARQITVAGNVTITELRAWYNNAPGNAHLGLYSDLAGVPGALLSDSGAIAVTANGQVIADIPDILVAPGNYWVASLTDGLRVQAGGTGASLAYATLAYGNLPVIFPAGTADNTDMNLAAAWCPSGVAPTPTVTVTASATQSPTQTATPSPVGTPIPTATLTTVPGAPWSLIGAVAANNSVEDMVRYGNDIYIVGDFTHVGPATGPALFWDLGGDAPANGFPQLAGTVQTAVLDGSGGWYIAGTINYAAGQPINGIVHVLSSGIVDTAFSAPVSGTNNYVYALVRVGNALYVGGSFSSISGVARANLAKIDALTGAVDPAFQADTDNTVQALSVFGSLLYVGGQFSLIKGSNRVDVARVDLSSGTVDPAFSPVVDGQIRSFASDGTNLYVGGAFSTFGGFSKLRLVKMDAASGTVDNSFSPNPDGWVWVLRLDGNDLYVGGDFLNIAGQAYAHGVRLNKLTGVLDTTFAPNPTLAVDAIAVDASKVWLGGNFDKVAGQARLRLARVNKSDGSVDSFNPSAGGTVYVLESNGSTMLIGGLLSSYGGYARNRVAKINASTGQVDPAFNADVPTLVRAVDVDASGVYIGGDFTLVNGSPRTRVAKLDRATGALVGGFSCSPNNIVADVRLQGSWLYLGGAFTTVGSTRNNIARVNATTGAVDAWNPNASGTVYRVVPLASSVFTSGVFTTIGGQARQFVAKLDTSTGAAIAGFNTKPNNPPEDMLVDGTRLVLAGSFTSITGQARNRLASVDQNNGTLTAFDPNANYTAFGLGMNQADLWSVGNFNTVGGLTRTGVVKLDKSTGAVDVSVPDLGSFANRIGFNDAGNVMYLGGTGAAVLGQPSHGFAMIAIPTPAATFTPSQTSTYTSTPTPTASPTPADAPAACVALVSVDGDPNEAAWSGSSWIPIQRVAIGTTSISAQYKVAWDASNMYVAVDVTDPALHSDSVNYYDDDGVEVYFDMSNNKSATYVVGDDFQFGFDYGDTVTHEENNSVAGVVRSTSITAGGYSMEIAIPWSTLGKSPSPGFTFGFDVGVNDDADGGVRDGQLMWSGDDLNYADTRDFGNMRLGGVCGTPTQTRTPTPTPMVCVDYAGGNSVGSFVSPLNLPQTVSASGQLLMVSVWLQQSGAPISTVTRGGTPLILLRRDRDLSSGQWLETWYQSNPNVDSSPIIVNNSSGTVAAESTVYSGVNLADPFGSQMFSSSTNNPATFSLSTTTMQSQLYATLLAQSGNAVSSTNGLIQRETVYFSGYNFYVHDRLVAIPGSTQATYGLTFSSPTFACLIEIKSLCGAWTPTATVTSTFTITPTPTPTATPSASPTATASATLSFTVLPTLTNTQVPGPGSALGGPAVANSVFAMARFANTIYVGGAMDKVGPRTGHGVPIDVVTGVVLPNFPTFSGPVKAVIIDGQGGWYVAGRFQYVAGVTHVGVVHILPNLAVDPAFDAGLDLTAGNSVNALWLEGNTLYLGGQFTSLNHGTALRNFLAAVNATTGSVLSFNSGTGPDWVVDAVVKFGSTVYFGGEFANVNATPRAALAAMDASSSALLPWDPSADNDVSHLLVTASAVYATGLFTHVGASVSRKSIAAFSPSGVGSVLSFDPQSDQDVNAMAFSGGRLFIGGTFTQLNATPRNNLAEVDPSTGAALGWNPNYGNEPTSLYPSGGLLYVGGYFGNNLGAVDMTTGALQSWAPVTNRDVLALAVQGNTVFAGGDFTAVSNIATRGSLLALDANSGALLSWNPNASDEIDGMDVDVSGNIYVGGLFATVGGAGRVKVARLLSGGTADPSFNPGTGPNGQVRAVRWDSASGKVYIGGDFTTVAGTSRKGIARLNPDGSLDSGFDPGTGFTGGSVSIKQIQLQSPGGKLFVGGTFTTYNGNSSKNLVRINSDGSFDSSFAVGAGFDNTVNALQYDAAADRLYVGGTFNKYQAVSRGNLVRLDAAALNDASFVAAVDDEVGALKLVNGSLIVGGNFTTILGQSRRGLATVNVLTQAVLPWNPGTDGEIYALEANANADRLYCGNDNLSWEVGQEPAGHLAQLILPALPTPTVTPPTSPTASPSATQTATPSATATATPTSSPSSSPTTTATATPSSTPSVTLTATASATPTATPSATPSATATATPSASPSPTATPTATPSVTLTATASATPTATPTETPSVTPTATASPSSTITLTATPSPSATPSATVTETPSTCVNTVAGTNSGTYDGEGTGIIHSLNAPRRPYGDAAGNIYIADTGNNRVRKLDISGNLSTVMGNGTAASGGDGGQAALATVNGPQAVFVSPLGEIYVAETAGNRIRKIDLIGNVSTIIGDGTASGAGDGGPANLAKVNGPRGMGMDAAGNLYFADSGNNEVRMISVGGNVSTVAGNGTPGYNSDGIAATSAWLDQPTDVAVNALGDFYIADRFQNRVRRVDHVSGQISTYAGNGAGIYNGEGLLATNAQLTYPGSLKLRPNGDLIIVCDGDNRIRQVDAATGHINTLVGNGGGGGFGGDGGDALGATLDQPSGVYVDAAGTLFFTDQGNQRLRVVAPCGGTPTFTITPTVTPSATQTASPTATASASPTASPTLTATPSATSSATPTSSPTATPSASPTASPTLTATPSATSSATPTSSPTATASASPTASPTLTATPSASPSATASASPTSTGTPTASPTVTETASPTVTPSASPTATPSASPSTTATDTPTVTPSATASSSASATPTASPTATASPSPSATPSASPSLTATPTATPSASATASPTVTLSATVTATPSASPTASPSATPSGTVSLTPSPSPSDTATASPTATPSPSPSATASITPSLTATPSASPSATPPPSATASPSSTPSATPSYSPSASPSATLTVSQTATPPPPTATGTPTQTPFVTATPSFTITPTFTVSDTPVPTQTPEVSAVLSHNIWHVAQGPLHIGIKAPNDGLVTVRVFNIGAEVVRMPFRAEVKAGQTEDAIWDGTNANGEHCAAGIYVVSIQGAGINKLLKVVLLK